MLQKHIATLDLNCFKSYLCTANTERGFQHATMLEFFFVYVEINN